MTELYEACKKYMACGYYGKAFECIEGLYKDNAAAYYKVVVAFRAAMKSLIERGVEVDANYELLRLSYCLTGRDRFDDFMIATEWWRKPEDRFWLVRREQLLPVCEALQALADGELDELFLSLPPRVGKTTIIMFFTIWQMLRKPEESNLYSSFTDKVCKTFYNGVLEVLQDADTYDWKSVFPEGKIAKTDANDYLIDIGRKKKYSSLTSRSVMGSLNGSCDASGIIIGDDLHSGIDEARSKDQMIAKWEVVRANLLSRKKGNAKILWVGTRWSLIDCIGNRLKMLESDPDCKHIRYKVINIPALNERDESNFDYMYHKGFTTADFKVIRASYEGTNDYGLWSAPYLGEPIEREGAVFSPTDLRYYNGELPSDRDPDRIVVVCDPAWGGGDYVAAVALYQYDADFYVADAVYSNADKYVTIPMMASLIKRNNAAALYIEGTRVTSSYAEELDKKLRADGVRINIQSTVKNWAGGRGKQQRIFDKAPEIRERMVFLDKAHQSKEYQAFMQNVFSFTVEGKNKNDDAPDVLSMAMVFLGVQYAKVSVISAKSLDWY